MFQDETFLWASDERILFGLGQISGLKIRVVSKFRRAENILHWRLKCSDVAELDWIKNLEEFPFYPVELRLRKELRNAAICASD